jgi:hypothetical protein
MKRHTLAAVVFAGGIVMAGAAPANAQGKGIRLWNLTSKTMAHFSLSPAGKNAYGANQCANDRDGTVDHDERLKITGVAPGRYDAKIGYVDGRICFARGLTLADNEVFSVEDSQLTGCNR